VVSRSFLILFQCWWADTNEGERRNLLEIFFLSDNEMLKCRYEAFMKYLRRLAPFFASPGFGFSYNSLIESIELDILRRKSNVCKTRSSSTPLTSSTVPNIEKFNESETKSKKVDTESPKPKKSLKDSDCNKEKSEKKKPVSIASSFPVINMDQKVLNNPKPSKEINSSSDIGIGKKRSLPSTEVTMVENKKRKLFTDTESIDSSPNSVFLTPSSSNSSPSENKSPIEAVTKPKVNAFAFLMNRSKELAQASKQKKLANATKTASPIKSQKTARF